MPGHRGRRWVRRLASIGSLGGVLLVAGSMTAPAAEPTPAPNASTVILISLDGTRPEDVVPGNMPALSAFARRGVLARRLVPSVPTNTFPNHVTLVTGVEPQNHGLVDNVFRDPTRGVFEKRDIHSWIEVEPIWSHLERAGIATAVFHWVGSEGAVRAGFAPRYWKPFSSRTPAAEKVDQILAWLDLPADRGRPRLICSWMHGADHAGHVHGPGSAAVRQRLREQDPQLARLIEGIGDRGLWGETTLLFVSDHGMLGHRSRVDLSALLAEAGIAARTYGIGGFATVVVEASDANRPQALARVVAVARAAGLDAFERAQAPEEARVGHVRFGDVVVRAPPGTAIVYAGLELEGFHGYPPETPEMGALLIAGGRGVDAGDVLGVVHGLDVAPTILALLGQPIPSAMQGRPIPALVAGGEASATLSPSAGRGDAPP